jgi:hypothetical protein
MAGPNPSPRLKAAGDPSGCRPADPETAKVTGRLAAWQAATEALMLAAEDRGPLMHAQVGMMKALHPQTPVYHSSRKDPHWGRCKLVRDR